ARVAAQLPLPRRRARLARHQPADRQRAAGGRRAEPADRHRQRQDAVDPYRRASDEAARACRPGQDGRRATARRGDRQRPGLPPGQGSPHLHRRRPRGAGGEDLDLPAARRPARREQEGRDHDLHRPGPPRRSAERPQHRGAKGPLPPQGADRRDVRRPRQHARPRQQPTARPAHGLPHGGRPGGGQGRGGGRLRRGRMTEPQKLSTLNLRKIYRGRPVVSDVSIAVAPGEVVGLLGPNGAGKTTTFYMVVGLTPPDSGKVFLGEEDITELPMYMRAQRGISYLPQEPSIFRRLSVEDNLRAIFETLDLPHAEQERRIDQLVNDLGLVKVRRNRGYSLSGGERRRVEIARALVISPWYILLDEPFAGIDPIAVLDIQGIIRHLKSMGIGILITDHNVRETLKITDRAYIINNGEILRSGTPPELASDTQVRKIYLGADFTL